MTHRERMEARAERRREWAASRAAKADAAHEGARQIMDMIPSGQPVLVGHHSERRHRRDLDRFARNMTESVESSRMAERHASAADELEAQMARSVYDDDADAIQRLYEKLDKLEGERDRIKAFNAACRKSKGVTEEALALLDDRQKADYLSTAKVVAWQLGKNGEMPAYALSNLGGVIRNTRQRLDRLQREKKAREAGTYRARYRQMVAKYGGACDRCGSSVEKGDTMFYNRREDERMLCSSCGGGL